MPSSITIWQLSDGKPGHLNQVRGLVAALRRRIEIELHVIEAPARRTSLWHWIRGKFPPGESLPSPTLILGAGHATHLALLAARRARGGKAIVLMTPQLPLCWFDLCLVPEHDEVQSRENVVFTKGALNNIEPAGSASPDRGLILIGGPSKNYLWSAPDLTAQVKEVVTQDPHIDWTLTTSRRTPADYVTELRQLGLTNLTITPVEETPAGWVGQRMQECGLVWVTEDSVSMVYEALTSGAAVGLLAMQRGKAGRTLRPGVARVMAGLDQLVEDHMVTTFAAWQSTGQLRRPAKAIDEADRCAQVVYDRFLR